MYDLLLKPLAAVAAALSLTGFLIPKDLSDQIDQLHAQISALESLVDQEPPQPFMRDLTFGSSGNDVMELQIILLSKGFTIPAGATGYFGAQTKAAVTSFQVANGITPSVGYFGPKTRDGIWP